MRLNPDSVYGYVCAVLAVAVCVCVSLMIWELTK